MTSGQFDVTTMPLQFLHQVQVPADPAQEAKPNFAPLLRLQDPTGRCLRRARARAISIAINRAEIVKGIVHGQRGSRVDLHRSPALDPADATKGIDQGGCRAGEEAARRGRLEDGHRRFSLQGRGKAHTPGLFHRAVSSARVSVRRCRATCARSASTATSGSGRHHRALQAGAARLRHLVGRLFLLPARRHLICTCTRRMFRCQIGCTGGDETDEWVDAPVSSALTACGRARTTIGVDQRRIAPRTHLWVPVDEGWPCMMAPASTSRTREPHRNPPRVAIYKRSGP